MSESIVGKEVDVCTKLENYIFLSWNYDRNKQIACNKLHNYTHTHTYTYSSHLQMYMHTYVYVYGYVHQPLQCEWMKWRLSLAIIKRHCCCFCYCCCHMLYNSYAKCNRLWLADTLKTTWNEYKCTIRAQTDKRAFRQQSPHLHLRWNQRKIEAAFARKASDDTWQVNVVKTENFWHLTSVYRGRSDNPQQQQQQRRRNRKWR